MVVIAKNIVHLEFSLVSFLLEDMCSVSTPQQAFSDIDRRLCHYGQCSGVLPGLHNVPYDFISLLIILRVTIIALSCIILKEMTLEVREQF